MTNTFEKVILGHNDKYFQRECMKRQVEKWEDGLRTNGDIGSYEWWYVDNEFDDGTKVIVIFYTKDRFDVKGKACPTVTIQISTPDGKNIIKTYHEKDKLIEADKNECNIQIKNSYLRGNLKEYELYFEYENIKFESKMKGTLPAWRPGNGHIYFGNNEDKFFAWLVPIPEGICNAKLTIDNEIKILSGKCYHDHNFGNIEMNKLFHHWYWSRAKIGDYTILACDLISESKYGYKRIPLFMLGKDGKILEDDENYLKLNKYETIIHPITNKYIDNKLEFIYEKENSKVIFSLCRKKDIAAITIPQTLDNMGYSYMRIVGNVELSIDINKDKEKLTSSSLWELMYFGENVKI